MLQGVWGPPGGKRVDGPHEMKLGQVLLEIHGGSPQTLWIIPKEPEATITAVAKRISDLAIGVVVVDTYVNG